MNDSLIVLVLQRFFPGWEPPADTGRCWVKALCPFHGESDPSASISFELNAFKCHACFVKGDAIKLLREREGVDYRTAKRIAEELSPGSYDSLSREPPRKPRRRIPFEPGTGVAEHQRPDQQVPTGVRGRRTPWS